MSENDFQREIELNIHGLHQTSLRDLKQLCMQSAAIRMEQEAGNLVDEDDDGFGRTKEYNAVKDNRFPMSVRLEEDMDGREGDIIIRFYDDRDNEEGTLVLNGNVRSQDTDSWKIIREGFKAATRQVAECTSQVSERELRLNEL